MNKFKRALRHLLTTTASGRRAFSSDSLHTIQAAIAEGELQHRAEVRLIVEPSMPISAVLDDMTPRERACELFAMYRVWDTEENCGVLVYINLADHDVEIVADRGAARVISDAEWEAVCSTMTHGYARGDYCDSTVAGLRQLNTLLAERFPDQGSRVNQLSDRPLVL
jgi:uncharacterized membrane protein